MPNSKNSLLAALTKTISNISYSNKPFTQPTFRLVIVEKALILLALIC